MISCIFITMTCWQVCNLGAISYSQKIDPRPCREKKMEIEREKRREEIQDLIRLEKLKRENKK